MLLKYCNDTVNNEARSIDFRHKLKRSHDVD